MEVRATTATAATFGEKPQVRGYAVCCRPRHAIRERQRLLAPRAGVLGSGERIGGTMSMMCPIKCAGRYGSICSGTECAMAVRIAGWDDGEPVWMWVCGLVHPDYKNSARRAIYTEPRNSQGEYAQPWDDIDIDDLKKRYGVPMEQ